MYLERTTEVKNAIFIKSFSAIKLHQHVNKFGTPVYRLDNFHSYRKGAIFSINFPSYLKGAIRMINQKLLNGYGE